MERTILHNLHEQIGDTVRLEGWVCTVRDQGKVIFFEMRDRGGEVQCVVFGKPDIAEIAKTLKPEYVVNVEGVVKSRGEAQINSNAANGDIEIEVTSLTVMSAAETLPFDLETDVNLDTLLDFRPLTLRRPRERAIFRVQHEIVNAYREYMTNIGCTEIQAPKLVGEDAEGGGEVFRLPYFYDKYAYLATSPQLYKQMMVGVFERVFTTGNVFRAEKHATSRHLNEYTSIDAEIGFIQDHTDIMRIETGLIRFLVTRLRERCADEFRTLDATIPIVPASGEIFPHLTLKQAQQLITDATGVDKTSADDLDPEDERWLCEYALREHGSDFIFITHFPFTKRPFYTYLDEEDPRYTKSFDLLFRGVEITTGGQRRHTFEAVKEGAIQKGIDPDKFAFFAQAFRYGMPPHGGWGMGLERLTQKFLGLTNVKEATLFPRDINRIDTRLATQDDCHD